MSRPVVGLTGYRTVARWGPWDRAADLIPVAYVESLARVGVRAVLLPPDPVDADVLDRLDGLVLAGGSDIDPGLSGTVPGPWTDTPARDRDAGECLLYRGARLRRLPVLGICRGLQLMVVAEGGRLHQHLPDLPGAILHRPRPGQFVDHGATFAPGSVAAGAVGAVRATVNSSHHQAVADPGRLTVTGWAEDDTVEAAEDPAAEFVLGVQWHPEETPGDPVSARVFAAFARAVGTSRWAPGGGHRSGVTGVTGG